MHLYVSNKTIGFIVDNFITKVYINFPTIVRIRTKLIMQYHCCPLKIS